jgi:HAD superfamily hydrolase (TIGR01484 family)
MGKPYASELKLLASTYSWALAADIEQLKASLADISILPLICIGSGGAYTTASFASQLHEKVFLQVSKVITPLLFKDTNLYRQKAVLIFSAGGGNPDVLGALKCAIEQEPLKIIVFCFQKDSPLSKLAKKYRNIDLIEFNLPWERDGFLATNSLLAFNVLLLRAYLEIASPNLKLPQTLNALTESKGDLFSKTSPLRTRCGPLWERQQLIVLYGPSASSAGIDIESKFTEAALGVTQIADYRNFAHGRHFWLAKHGKTTAVLALITKDDKALADKTIKLIPKDIPIVKVETSLGGALADLALTTLGFYVAGFAGEANLIDPGRPGVPRFGSQIYRLNAFGKLSQSAKSKSEKLEDVAIIRKTQSTIKHLRIDSSLDYWRKAYKEFAKKIQEKYFQAIVFDYDGTLCDGKDRFNGISPEVISHVEELLSANIILGIATGRGKSVRKDLQKKLPKNLWSKIIIGYYNGSVIGTCGDNSLPNSSDVVDESLAEIAENVKKNKIVLKLCDVTTRKTQITIEPKSKPKTEFIWNTLQHIVNSTKLHSYKIVRSSHSFDIICNDVSKCDVVNFIQRQFPASTILCIGDKGKFPGNDYSLLHEPYSLSVDEVSSEEDSCWNLAPANFRGVQATLRYLESFSYSSKGVKFKLK